jgi:hypothetical protein
MTCNLLLAVFVFFLIPETRGVPLEEVDVLFGGANHIEKGGNLLQVEDAHHAHIGVDNKEAHDRIEMISQEQPGREIREY